MKKILSFICALWNLISIAQITPNLEGEYYLEKNKAMLYIFNKNEFLVLGYETAVKGKVEITNNVLEFKTDHQTSDFFLYGRKSTLSKIILYENQFRDGLYFSDKIDNNISLSKIQKNQNYCSSYVNFLPLEKVSNTFLFKSDSKNNFLTAFSINKKYNDFLLEYLRADTDVEFLNHTFEIKENKLEYGNNIQKKPLNLTKDIQQIIKKIEEIDFLFSQEKIYLNEDFELIFDRNIDLAKYSFNNSEKKYTIKKMFRDDSNFNVLYEYIKIKSARKTDIKYTINEVNLLELKCLKTPKRILKESEDEKTRKKPVLLNEDTK